VSDLQDKQAQERDRAKQETSRRRAEAKADAEKRRVERKARKRRCTLCGVEENDKTPFQAHPDGIGPACRDSGVCAMNKNGIR